VLESDYLSAYKVACIGQEMDVDGHDQAKKKKYAKRKNLNLRADRQGCWLTRFDANLRLTLWTALSLCY
jgi:hypothetical protein